MRVPSLIILVTLVTVVFAGCVADDAPQTDGSPATNATPGGYVQNQYLLGQSVAEAGTQVSSGSEPAILVRSNGDIWIGDTTGVRRSQDGGQTWQIQGALVPPIAHVLRDGWDLAEDEAGNLYAVALAEAALYVFQRDDTDTSWNRVDTIVNPFTGLTPPAAVSAVPDRPWITARDDGVVALIYNDSGQHTHCAISYDGGMTFADRKGGAGRPISGGAAFDTSDDTLYWTDKAGNVYRALASGTATSAVPAPTQCLTGGTKFDMGMFGFSNDNHQIQVDAEDGKVYTAFADTGKNIVVASVEDFDTSFFPTVLDVSPPELKTNTFATIAVHDGRIAVAWYGSETAGNPASGSFNGDWNVYVAVVDDFWGTPTVANYRLTDTPNHQGTICMSGIACSGSRELLDYFMVDWAPDGDLHVAFVDDVRPGIKTYHVEIVAP